jgi:exosortase
VQQMMSKGGEASGASVDLWRHGSFLMVCALLAAMFYRALWIVVGQSLEVDKYSHILLVGPVSAVLLWQDRKKILARTSIGAAGIVMLAALLGIFEYFSRFGGLSESGMLSFSFLIFVGSCLAAFVACYGMPAFRGARFALLFLLLMVPLPDAVMHRSIVALQNGSADVTCWFFRMAHIPYVREGTVLQLPKVEIYIAEECSGIRSTLVLLLSSLVLGHLYLRSWWSRVLLVLAVIPITIAKNGLRIFTLSTLGMYVDPSFLTGRLHHQGGFIFFGVSFAGLLLTIWLFRKTGLEPDTKVRRSFSGAPAAISSVKL